MLLTGVGNLKLKGAAKLGENYTIIWVLISA